MVGARQSEYKDEPTHPRDIIGEAKDVLIGQQAYPRTRRFDTLRRAAQRMSVMLRDVAKQIAERRRGA